jgi:alpha-tubulin suppressor-like RCC1 family protein
VKCWGYNWDGQLGLGDRVNRFAAADMGDALPALDFGGRKVKKIVAGQGRAYALCDDDTVWAWGNNAQGVLGLGSAVEHALSPTQLALGANVHFVDVATSYGTSCAVASDGRVKCWGLNTGGALGLGDARDRGIDAADMGDNLPFLDL